MHHMYDCLYIVCHMYALIYISHIILCHTVIYNVYVYTRILNRLIVIRMLIPNLLLHIYIGDRMFTFTSERKCMSVYISHKKKAPYTTGIIYYIHVLYAYTYMYYCIHIQFAYTMHTHA